MQRGLFSLPRWLAAANRTAFPAFCASVFAENAHRGGGISAGEVLHDLRSHPKETKPSMENQESAHDAG